LWGALPARLEIANDMSATDGFTLLRETLDLIAHQATPEARLPRLLHLAQQGLGAQAAWIALFEPTPVYFTDGIDNELLAPLETVHDWIKTSDLDFFIDHNTLSPELASQYQAALYAPIRYKERVVALVGLLFAQTPTLTQDQTTLLASVIDGSTIDAKSERICAHHDP
jgi:hypothetical protein